MEEKYTIDQILDAIVQADDESPLRARKLLEDAGEQPAAVLVRQRRYRELTGGGADGQSDVKTVQSNQAGVGVD